MGPVTVLVKRETLVVVGGVTRLAALVRRYTQAVVLVDSGIKKLTW